MASGSACQARTEPSKSDSNSVTVPTGSTKAPSGSPGITSGDVLHSTGRKSTDSDRAAFDMARSMGGTSDAYIGHMAYARNRSIAGQK
jgi:hypothetical protein